MPNWTKPWRICHLHDNERDSLNRTSGSLIVQAKNTGAGASGWRRGSRRSSIPNCSASRRSTSLAARQREGQPESDVGVIDRTGEEHWRWRFRMAQRIAAQLDPHLFGVKAFYLIGSTKNATAGPESDIDLLLHLQGTEDQKRELLPWLEGWSRCLSEINFLRTGYRTEGLLDVHLITDVDIAQRSSYAVKIDAITDPARKLPMKEA